MELFYSCRTCSEILVCEGEKKDHAAKLGHSEFVAFTPDGILLGFDTITRPLKDSITVDAREFLLP